MNEPVDASLSGQSEFVTKKLGDSDLAPQKNSAINGANSIIHPDLTTGPIRLEDLGVDPSKLRVGEEAQNEVRRLIDRENRLFEKQDTLTNELIEQKTRLETAVKTIREQWTQIDTLVTESNIDPLTRLGNRERLQKKAEVVFTVAESVGIPISVLLLDIDNFKQYNTLFGLGGGDDVIVQVSEKIADLTRTEDTDRSPASDLVYPPALSTEKNADVTSDIQSEVFRYGGDEFAALLPGMAAEVLAKRGPQVVAGFSGFTVNVKDLAGTIHTVPVSVSVGGTTFVPVPKDDVQSLAALNESISATQQDYKKTYPRRKPLSRQGSILELAKVEANKAMKEVKNTSKNGFAQGATIGATL